jgi:hypothetical protein
MEEAAKIADVLETHLQCPFKLSHAELAQVNQGAFRAVLAFLVQRVRSPETVRRARASSLLRTRALPTLQFKDKEELRRALGERETWRRQNTSQRQTVRTSKLRKMALEVFHSKVGGLIAQIKQFSVIKPRPQTSSKLEYLSLSNYSEMLLSLYAQNNELPTQALSGLIQSSGLDSSRQLIIETITQSTEARVCDFQLVKTETDFSTSALQIVERLKGDLATAYSSEWMQFREVEGQLAEISQLQTTYKAVKAAADNSSTYSKQLRALLDLRLQVSGLQAASSQLDFGIQQLKDHEKELTQTLKLRKSQCQRCEAMKAEADFLQTKAVAAVDQNAALRVTISKHKLRVHDFLQKHVLGMKEKLPVLARPIFNCVSREAEAFKVWQPLPAPRTALTDSLLYEVYMTVSVSPYRDVSEVIEQLQATQSEAVLSDLPTPLQGLPSINAGVSADGVSVGKLHDLMQEWQTQGGQYCIPWRKDELGRNIEDWMTIWRPVALQQQYQP